MSQAAQNEGMVEPMGFEPTTSSMPSRRAPNCATAPPASYGITLLAFIAPALGTVKQQARCSCWASHTSPSAATHRLAPPRRRSNDQPAPPAPPQHRNYPQNLRGLPANLS
jgi:hypothetical protein